MSAWSPKSTAALVRERDLEFRCKQLLTTQCGVHDPHVILVDDGRCQPVTGRGTAPRRPSR